MSDDIVDRLREQAAWIETSWFDPSAYVIDLQRSAADEIVRLRTRVAELEAALNLWTNLALDEGERNIHLRAARADDKLAVDILTPQWAAERALADQLAEALRGEHESLWSEGRGPTYQAIDALAAYDRARTPPAPQLPVEDT